MSKTITVYTDAGYHKLGEPPTYLAFVFKLGKKVSEATKVAALPSISSCHAEYMALYEALQWCLFNKFTRVHFKNDNQTMIRQLQGKYRIKEQSLILWFNSIRLYEKTFVKVKYSWIPREKNLADRLIRELKGGAGSGDSSKART